jgi:hypothetical protein
VKPRKRRAWVGGIGVQVQLDLDCANDPEWGDDAEFEYDDAVG